MAITLVAALGALSAACGGGGSSSSAGGASTSSATVQGTSDANGSTSTSGTASTGSASTGTGGGGPTPGPIGEWTDGPGVCPMGLPQVDITTAAQLASASRGEDAYAGDAPATCYLIHDGNYDQSGVLMFLKKGGEPNGNDRYFIGESRTGVVIHGRAGTDETMPISDLTVSNLTFDLTGYSQTGAFNTFSLYADKNIHLDHLTFTGDCATGFKGGHIETNGTDGLLVEACIIEKFGNCGGGGHEDHGVYLASGKNLIFRNNVIRGNSSRGIQMYTAAGVYGTLENVLVERNRITQNGHGDQEDGLIINSSGTGTVDKVTIIRNIFDRNFFSGIRFIGGLESNVVVTLNTFASNGAGSSSQGRSEINLDVSGSGAGTAISQNIFDVGNTLINDCYDASTLGFGFANDFVHGAIPSGPKGNCVGAETMGDPQFVDSAGGDFHTQNAAAQMFGAYAP